MSDTSIFLSICIPTYNRGNALKITLESITNQKIFLETNEVEIVISDNHSTDNTQSISEEFEKKFSGKIIYSRNSENIGAGFNFESALSKGNGAFLKLNNDSLILKNGCLVEMIKIIKATLAEKPIIFFTNGIFHNGNQIEICNNLNEFVVSASFMSTSIACFGIWRDEFRNIANFSKNENLLLIQTDIIFRQLENGKRAIVLKDSYFASQDVGPRGGYNIAEIFGKNYLSLLKKYVSSGILSKEAFEAEKKSLLLNHIIPYYFAKNNNYLKDGFFIHLQDYLHDDYFYKAIESRLLA